MYRKDSAPKEFASEPCTVVAIYGMTGKQEPH